MKAGQRYRAPRGDGSATSTGILALLGGPLLVCLCSCSSKPAMSFRPAVDANLSDAITPPDLGAVDRVVTTGTVGRPCTPGPVTNCDPGSVCVAIAGGVCALVNCKLDDPSTPTTEDNCPAGSACTQVEGDADDVVSYCLPICEPRVEANACQAINAALACDPSSRLLTGRSEVCAHAACERDSDCGSGNDLNPDARCDTSNGVCFSLGQGNVAVGSPCEATAQCGPGQTCLRTVGVVSPQQMPGGYCTIVGCRYGGPWTCPSGSRCFALSSDEGLSACVAVGCKWREPATSDGCRDDTPEQPYRCSEVEGIGACWLF